MPKTVLTIDHIKNFLKDHQLMAVATYGDFPWIASVYYAFDKDLNLYFLSSPKTLHVRHLLKNPQVAVAIADSHQKNSDKKLGLQMYGKAQQISGLEKLKYALELWKKHIEVVDPKLTAKAVTGSMFKITPKRIKIFGLFKSEEGNEPILEL